MKQNILLLTTSLIFILAISGAVSATETQDIGTDITNKAISDLAITESINSEQVLLITTAGSASYKGSTTEDCLEGVVDTTSTITPGNGNLITLNEPNGALEFTFVKKVSSTSFMAGKYTVNPSGTSYVITNDNPVYFSNSMTESDFKKAKQQLGNNGFELISIAYAWMNGAPKDLLKIAGQSGGISEGLISAYAMSQSFIKNYPLITNTQSYHVLVSPGGGDDNVPMFLMDDTPLKWATSGSTKYYDFYGMSNGNLNDNIYIWWDTEAISGNLTYWTLNPQNKIDFGTIVTGALSEIKYNNWLLGKLSSDASSLVSIEKLATIDKTNFDYLWANGIDKTYLMNLSGSVPTWTDYSNVKPVNDYNAMFTVGENAANAASNAFIAQGLGALNANDLVITSAGYSEVSGLSFGALNGIINVTGIQLKNLLTLKRGSQTPLWFVFVKNPTSTNGPLNAIFINALGQIVPVVYNGTSYDIFDISATNLAGNNGTEGYTKSTAVSNAYIYSKPSYAQQDFYIVSLANLWATGAPYDFLRPACDGGCPGSGLSMGYVILNYIKTALPLGPNEYYMYIGIPAHCKEQVLLNGLGVSPAEGTYFTPGLQSTSTDASSVGIAIKWNSVTNTGKAVLIDYNSAIVSAIQPPNSYLYKTMYWAIWYLQHGFPGTDQYATVLSAYSIAKRSDGTSITVPLTHKDLNNLIAANENPISFMQNFVDVTAPTVTISPSQNTPIITPASIQLYMDEEGSIYYSLNGSQMTAYTSPIQIINEGSYTLSYYAVDLAGNTAATVNEIFTVTIPVVPNNPGTDIISEISAGIAQAVNWITQQTTPAEIAPGIPLGDNPKTNKSGIPLAPVAGTIILAAILILVYLGRNSIKSAVKSSERFGK